MPSGRGQRHAVVVNYEDRTDLTPPSQVVSAPILAKLRLGEDASGLLDRAADDPWCVSVSQPAEQAMVARVREDTAQDRGAPREAAAVEQDAMFPGYRFGRLVLGTVPDAGEVSAAALRERTEAMYLFDLFLWQGRRVPIHRIIERNGVAVTGALEEA